MRACGPVFMYCALRHVFYGAECVGSRFNVLCARTHFRRSRGCQVLFSCFTLPNMFFAVPSVSGSVLMFCAPGLVFDGNEGVRSRFRVLRSRSRFPRYQGRRASFSWFALLDSLLVVPRASELVFKFCVPGLVFYGIEGVGSRFQVLSARTLFRRNR
jgi:hypothetical protein